MENSFINDFKMPPKKYRVSPIAHVISADIGEAETFIEKIADYGYGGVVTNVPYANGFTSNPDNVAYLGELIGLLERKGLSYWLYDEMGYPSGQGGGLTLDGHPELAAKGFYMHRRIAYEPTHAEFRLDDESDKIIWAAKYPIETPGVHESIVQFDKMIPLEFTAERVSCELAANEVMYVFCVKDSYEGTHSTHNVSSFKHNINVMDRRAVRRFIDCCFEPTAAGVPDAFSRAVNVFTDEPSLQVAYVRSYEVWPYALAPYVDGMFEAYEEKYGESIYPSLPLIFEGDERAYPVRVKFYSLVGELIADAYSGQLSEWCEAHGGGFSGHYLMEESITNHVKQYGDYVRVLRAASYPGIDILNCYPEIYGCSTTAFAQMAMRKEKKDGMMVEICPFANINEFKKAPLDNMTSIMGLLYLGGVRVTNSYFTPDFFGGYTNREESRRFNEYVGRLGVMLDGKTNDRDTFVYYPLEDAQAKLRPLYTAGGGDYSTESRLTGLLNALYDAGIDFGMLDGEDLCELLERGELSGCTVKNIIVPETDIMYGSSAAALRRLSELGVNVIFNERTPHIDAESGAALELSGARVLALGTLFEELGRRSGCFTGAAEGGLVARGKFRDGEHTIYMLCSRSRTDAYLDMPETEALICDPSDGSVTKSAVSPLVSCGKLKIPAMRAVFVRI